MQRNRRLRTVLCPGHSQNTYRNDLPPCTCRASSHLDQAAASVKRQCSHASVPVLCHMQDMPQSMHWFQVRQPADSSHPRNCDAAPQALPAIASTPLATQRPAGHRPLRHPKASYIAGAGRSRQPYDQRDPPTNTYRPRTQRSRRRTSAALCPQATHARVLQQRRGGAAQLPTSAHVPMPAPTRPPKPKQ